MNAPKLDLPQTLSAETPHFLIRTLNVADAHESWCEWLMDARAQTNLNATPRRLTLDEVRAYIASFDRIKSHIMGIFEKATGKLVGIRAAYVDRARRECLLNTLIGEAGARGKGAQRETRYAMHNFVLEDLDLDSACASVVGENEYMLRTLSETGWIHEHTSVKPRANGEGFVQLHHFRLTREVWRTSAAAQAKAYCTPPA
jgi:RimJ/RimL family protein N-acetyltransferase